MMPFDLRKKGLAIYLSAQQPGNAFDQFRRPDRLGRYHITWKYYAVYIAVDCVLVVIIYLYFPETEEMAIEEISLVFDYGIKEGRRRAVESFEEEIEVAESTDVSRKGSAVNHLEVKNYLES